MAESDETPVRRYTPLEQTLKITGKALTWALFPVTMFNFCKVKQYERLVLFRLGKFKRLVGPGVIYVYPFLDTVEKIDMRIRSQEFCCNALTKDALTVNVIAVIYYQIVDPIAACINVKNVYDSLTNLCATGLRTIISGTTLKDITDSTELLANVLRRSTTDWGLDIIKIEMLDITIPEPLQRAMAAEAEATCDARAKNITAQGEVTSAEQFSKAAEVIGDRGLKLRQLQTLSEICSEKNTTVIGAFF
jgi:erythrocyte band 7 integral membrane protein